MLRACIPALVLISLLSCSQAAPRIALTSLRLVYHEGKSAPVERISFFTFAQDEDGALDLEELYLVNDADQLYWMMSEKDWLSVQSGGQSWIGSHDLAMKDDAPFPRGVYRAIITDKSGERSERALTLGAPSEAARPFPKLSIENGKYTITSTYPRHRLVAYAASGAMLQNRIVGALEGTVPSLGFPAETNALSLFDEDESAMVAAFTNPVPIH